MLFDFDGVLIESEYLGNKQIADWLTANGYPTSVEQSMATFMGLGKADFLQAVERWIGGPVPNSFHTARDEEDRRVMAAGIDAVAGAVEFVRALPHGLPKAIVSSSSTAWIARHLEHIGLRDAFGDHLYSGREHVERGKPAPDLYLHAAAALGMAIEDCLVIEDSPVGAAGAVASEAYVVGLCAGSHCAAGHGERLRALGVDAVAASWGEVAALCGLPQPAVGLAQARPA